MFHKSFKPAKCKTSLKLACSRIKLLKNKKEVQVKQMKRELAKLLESGQDRTAMIRVEHVVVEEKKLSAYDLIEIYCELIVARLQIIESQKNCPIDLKEAITSVIFASSGCVDVPELMDVRKQFSSKYGKEFVSAAIELRPNCGVARMMIEKLSVKAPDGQTKIKILKSIAEEHNIKWDPSADNDPTPSENMLNGPSTFGKASQMNTNHPNIQVQPSYDDKGQSAFQVPFSRDEKYSVPTNFYDHNRRSGHDYQNNAPTDISDSMEPISVSLCPGSENGGREFRHSYSGGPKWNMEFKDAAEAAQAAAEAADQASVAARAAAQLSSRENVTRQYSSGSSYDMYSGSRFEGSRSSSLNSHSSSSEGNSTKSESSDRMSFSRQFNKSCGEQVDVTNENIGYSAQLSNTFSHYHPKDSQYLVNDSSFGVVDKRSLQSDNEGGTSSHDKASSVFDESGSGDDEDVAYRYKEHESVLLRNNVSHPVTFDDSDGPTSESEDDINRSKPVGSSEFLSKHDVIDSIQNESWGFTKSSLVGKGRKLSFSNDSNSRQGHPNGRSKIEEKFGFSDFHDKSHAVLDNDNSHLYSNPMVEQLSRPWLVHEQVKDTISESDSEVVENCSELKLGMLRGGLRNKGYTGNAFFSNRPVDAISSSSRFDQRVQTSHSFGVDRQDVYDQKANRKSKSMSSNAQLDHEKIPRGLGRRNHNMTIKVKNKSISYFDSDSSDSEEYLPQQTPTSKTRSGIGFIRRTKASPHGPNATISTERQVAPGHNAETTTTLTEPHAHSESSYHVGQVDWARMVARPLSKKVSRSARELSPNHHQRVVLPSTTISPNTLSLSATESPSKAKPSHVHPKLPDIDTFTAHFQSLRSNRR